MSKFSHFSHSMLADPAEPEDDFVAGLVHRMTHSMLEDCEEEEEGEEVIQAAEEYHSRRMWGAMQQDFAPVSEHQHQQQRRSGGWSSSPSPAVSPPTPLQQQIQYHSQQNDAWELLHMAAQEVMRLKMGRTVPVPPAARDELRHSPSSFRHGEIPSSAPYNGGNKPACPSAFGQQEWKQRSTPRPHNCYQAQNGIPASAATYVNRRSRVYQQQQQQQQSRQGSRGVHPVGYGRSSYYNTAAAAAAQAANSSGMRAVFLRGPSSTSSGTGVFLPQAAGTGSNRDQNRRPSCSTVLLPSRIVEVLNLNVDGQGQGQQQQQQLHSVAAEANNVVRHGRDDEYLSAQLSKSYAACSPTRWRSAAEHALPTEWTY